MLLGPGEEGMQGICSGNNQREPPTERNPSVLQSKHSSPLVAVSVPGFGATREHLGKGAEFEIKWVLDLSMFMF